jgi:hypothetical protein
MKLTQTGRRAEHRGSAEGRRSAEGRGQSDDRGHNVRRGCKVRRVIAVPVCTLLLAAYPLPRELCPQPSACPLPSALIPVSVSVRAEIIDRVLAILPGQIVTLSDVEAALDLGLVEAPGAGDRIGGGLAAVIDRVLMLNEVRRVSPPEPSPAAIDARVASIRERFGSPAELLRLLAARGLDETVLRLYAADDLRLASYLDERFSAAAQPTDEEIRQAGESARLRLTEERRRALVTAWTDELRRRAEVVVLQ